MPGAASRSGCRVLARLPPPPEKKLSPRCRLGTARRFWWSSKTLCDCFETNKYSQRWPRNPRGSRAQRRRRPGTENHPNASMLS